MALLVEEMEVDTPDSDRVPVTIITGFLGSGKTTLLNHILTATHGKKIAVVENEFGDVSIDDALIARNSHFTDDEEIVEVLNGCICCSVRGDLVKILEKLAARTRAGELALDGIIIETTGMADPAPVAQTFLVHDEIAEFARLDGIVTLVDAKHVERHLNAKKPKGVVNEASAQVAFADRLLLNKTDLVKPRELERVEARLRGLNPFAPIVRCRQSTVSVDSVLGIHGFDLQRALQASPQLLNVDALPTQHDASVGSVSLDQGAPRHMRTVLPGALDLELAQNWIQELLTTQGEDIFRMKGVLNIAHAAERFVFHAVHMSFSGTFEAPWADDEPRQSKMVFIGKNLDGAALAASFNDCRATPESLQAKAEALRFALGDEVECKTGADEWSAGEVVALMYRADEMLPGLVAPYKVRLDDEGGHGHAEGRCVWVPADDEELIRSRRRRSARLRPPPHVCDPNDHEHSHDHDGDDAVCESCDGHEHGHAHVQ